MLTSLWMDIFVSVKMVLLEKIVIVSFGGTFFVFVCVSVCPLVLFVRQSLTVVLSLFVCPLISVCFETSDCLFAFYLFQTGLFHLSYRVDKICDNCDANAVCLYGKCVCKNGFAGNGKQCKSKYTNTGTADYKHAPTLAISQVIFLLFLFTEISDICIPNPCKNSGKCVNAPQDSFDCICVKGFTGPLCECKSSFFTPTVTSTYFTFQ